MDGVQLVGDTEGDAQSNSEQFYQEDHQQQRWGQAQEALAESVLLDQSEQEAHWDVLQDQGSEDQIDEVQKIREVYFERKGVEAQLNTKEVEHFDQTVETQVDQGEEVEKQVNQREDIEKRVDQSKVENQVNQKEEVQEQEEEAENQTDQNEEVEELIVQKEEVERKVHQEDEFKKVERVIQKKEEKKENQINQEVNEYLHQKEHLDLNQETAEEVDKQKEFQEEVSLKEKEAGLKEESKEKVNQEQELEEQVNDKVKEHLIKQEEQINHKKDTEKLDQKNTEVDWKERFNKVPTYRRQSISESRQKWELHDKEPEPILDNNVNNRERGEKIKFIEKELQTAGVIMAEAKTSRFGGTNEKCAQCNRTVYAMEKMEVIGRVMHKTCFRCCKCNSPLSVGRFSVGGADLYCLTHYKQAFREKGTYDVFTPNNPCKGKWQQNIDTPGAPKAQE